MFSWNRIIEQKRFLETVSNDPQMIDTMIELLAQQSEDTVNTMVIALEAADWRSVQRAVHDLKNIGRSVASSKLIKYSQGLDKMAKEKKVEELRKSVARTIKLLAQAGKELRSLRKAL